MGTPGPLVSSKTIFETNEGSLSWGAERIPYLSASAMTFLANSARTSCLACSPYLRTCAGVLCWARASARAAVAARLACASRALDSALNWSWICPMASLRKVPGPKTTLAGLLRARRAHGPSLPPGGTWPAGALPEMQPSRPWTRRMSEVSASWVTGSRTST